MRLGVTFGYQNYGDWERFEALERGEQVGPPAISDYQIWSEQMACADLVEPLGFDTLWTVEQHAAPYMMTPDATQYLSIFAAKTKRIDVGSMVTVLPWHNPVRLAEQITTLQYVLGPKRKYFLGIGRGLAVRNFKAMGASMDDSRELLAEVYEVLKLAFTQELFSFKGAFFEYENVSVRPRPLDPSTVLEALGAWTSQTSLRFMAERGLHPITTPNKTMEEWLEEFETFNQIRQECGYGPARRPVLESPMYCCESEQEAREGVEQFFSEYVDSVIRLYEIGTENFAKGKGFAEYAKKGSDYGDGSAENAREILTTKLLRDGIWGTPEQCVEKVIAIHELADPSEFILFMGTGSMSGAQIEKSLRLFGEKAMPRLSHVRAKREALLTG